MMWLVAVAIYPTRDLVFLHVKETTRQPCSPRNTTSVLKIVLHGVGKYREMHCCLQEIVEDQLPNNVYLVSFQPQATFEQASVQHMKITCPAR